MPNVKNGNGIDFLEKDLQILEGADSVEGLGLGLSYDKIYADGEESIHDLNKKYKEGKITEEQLFTSVRKRLNTLEGWLTEASDRAESKREADDKRYKEISEQYKDATDYRRKILLEEARGIVRANNEREYLKKCRDFVKNYDQWLEQYREGGEYRPGTMESIGHDAMIKIISGKDVSEMMVYGYEAHQNALQTADPLRIFNLGNQIDATFRKNRELMEKEEEPSAAAVAEIREELREQLTAFTGELETAELQVADRCNTYLKGLENGWPVADLQAYEAMMSYLKAHGDRQDAAAMLEGMGNTPLESPEQRMTYLHGFRNLMNEIGDRPEELDRLVSTAMNTVPKIAEADQMNHMADTDDLLQDVDMKDEILHTGDAEAPFTLEDEEPKAAKKFTERVSKEEFIRRAQERGWGVKGDGELLDLFYRIAEIENGGLDTVMEDILNTDIWESQKREEFLQQKTDQFMSDSLIDNDALLSEYIKKTGGHNTLRVPQGYLDEQKEALQKGIRENTSDPADYGKEPEVPKDPDAWKEKLDALGVKPEDLQAMGLDPAFVGGLSEDLIRDLISDPGAVQEEKQEEAPVENEEKEPEEKKEEAPIENENKAPEEKQEEVPVENENKAPEEKKEEEQVKNEENVQEEKKEGEPVKNEEKLPEEKKDEAENKEAGKEGVEKEELEKEEAPKPRRLRDLDPDEMTEEEKDNDRYWLRNDASSYHKMAGQYLDYKVNAKSRLDGLRRTDIKPDEEPDVFMKLVQDLENLSEISMNNTPFEIEKLVDRLSSSAIAADKYYKAIPDKNETTEMRADIIRRLANWSVSLGTEYGLANNLNLNDKEKDTPIGQSIRALEERERKLIPEDEIETRCEKAEELAADMESVVRTMKEKRAHFAKLTKTFGADSDQYTNMIRALDDVCALNRNNTAVEVYEKMRVLDKASRNYMGKIEAEDGGKSRNGSRRYNAADEMVTALKESVFGEKMPRVFLSMSLYDQTKKAAIKAAEDNGFVVVDGDMQNNADRHKKINLEMLKSLEPDAKHNEIERKKTFTESLSKQNENVIHRSNTRK